jgi:hypothetical protein
VTFIAVGTFVLVFIVFPGVGRIIVTGCAVGLDVGTAGDVARDTHWCAGVGRSAANAVAGGTLGCKLARCGYRQFMPEIGHSMDDDVVAVVTRILVSETDVDIMARHANTLLR